MQESREVHRVIVKARCKAGQRYAIVELGDGRLGITRDEQVLQTVSFDASEMDACVREFVRRTGLDLGGRGGGSRKPGCPDRKRARRTGAARDSLPANGRAVSATSAIRSLFQSDWKPNESRRFAPRAH